MIFTLNGLPTGLTDLRAQLIDHLGSTVGSAMTTTFTEIGSGQYLFETVIDSSFVGAIRFYRQAAPSTVYFTLALNSLADIPASSSENTVAAYLYTRNNSGNVTAGLSFYYAMRKAPNGFGSSFDGSVKTVVSNGSGLASVDMVVGAIYQYWVEQGGRNTVTITNSTPDPYALPEVS